MAAWPVLLVIFALCAKQAWVSVSQHRSAFLVAAVMLPLAWSLNASPESGQLAGMSYHLLALNLTALMLGTSAAFCLGVLLFFPYLWLLGRLAYVSHQRLVRIASAFVGELGFPPLGIAFACQYLYLYFSEWFLGCGGRNGVYRCGFGRFVGLGGCV